MSPARFLPRAEDEVGSDHLPAGRLGVTWEVVVIVVLVLVVSALAGTVFFVRRRHRRRRQYNANLTHDEMRMAAGGMRATQPPGRWSGTDWNDQTPLPSPTPARTSRHPRSPPSYAPPPLPYGLGRQSSSPRPPASEKDSRPASR